MKKVIMIAAVALSLGNVTAQTVTPQTKLLLERNKEFRKEIIQIAPHVYTASGYDASNITMIIGQDGAVLIDAGKFTDNVEEIYKEFRKITDKPITGIILTHGHGDHTRGLPVFLRDNKPQVWAAENFGSEDAFPKAAGFLNPRSYHQSGMLVPPELRINNGVGPTVYPGGKFKSKSGEDIKSLYVPFSKDVITNFVSQPRQTITISGITLELLRADGETADHLVIFYPKEKILFPGDLYYKSFPNLYAIRGTEYRDVNKWIESLNMMLKLDANAIAQGHTRPIIGKEAVKKALTHHRDAIQFVFKKTIEGMNKGMTPDELVEYVKLPEYLAEDPNLVPYYGRMEWAIRNIYSGYMGWYDGNPTNLCPLSPKSEAEKYIELVGGKENLLKAAQKAFKQKEYQWCCELVDKLLAIDKSNKTYRNLKADALSELALRIVTATGRNYYNSIALELRQGDTNK